MSDDLELAVCRIFAEVLDRDMVPAQARLTALGVDSMALIDISVRIEATWGIEMPDLDALGHLQIETVAELVEYVRGQVQS